MKDQRGDINSEYQTMWLVWSRCVNICSKQESSSYHTRRTQKKCKNNCFLEHYFIHLSLRAVKGHISICSFIRSTTHKISSIVQEYRDLLSCGFDYYSQTLQTRISNVRGLNIDSYRLWFSKKYLSSCDSCLQEVEYISQRGKNNDNHPLDQTLSSL